MVHLDTLNIRISQRSPKYTKSHRHTEHSKIRKSMVKLRLTELHRVTRVTLAPFGSQRPAAGTRGPCAGRVGPDGEGGATMKGETLCPTKSTMTYAHIQTESN